MNALQRCLACCLRLRFDQLFNLCVHYIHDDYDPVLKKVTVVKNKKLREQS